MKLEGDWLHLNPLLLQMIQRVSRRIRDRNFPELISQSPSHEKP